jgi:hypothetical protein
MVAISESAAIRWALLTGRPFTRREYRSLLRVLRSGDLSFREQCQCLMIVQAVERRRVRGELV